MRGKVKVEIRGVKDLLRHEMRNIYKAMGRSRDSYFLVQKRKVIG